MKKQLITILIVIIIVNVISTITSVFLPYESAVILLGLTKDGTTIAVVVSILWFFYPYIKRGINYLINHRDD